MAWYGYDFFPSIKSYLNTRLSKCNLVAAANGNLTLIVQQKLSQNAKRTIT